MDEIINVTNNLKTSKITEQYIVIKYNKTKMYILSAAGKRTIMK